MNSENTYLFQCLKAQLFSTFSKNHSVTEAIEDWKGETITAFQEDLFLQLKAKVSEKWFYTYIKKTPEKLPRIDILNLLSKYVGYDNWEAFKVANKSVTKTTVKNSKKWLWTLLLIPITFLIYSSITAKNTFEFCFLDDIKNEAITKTVLDIKILQKKESPIYLKTDSLGCFTYKTKQESITFVVQSPYHKTDTIIRHIGSNSNQIIKLKPDDYALMLHYYTNGNIKDWKKHKEQLHLLFADNATIYQLYENNIGIEIYSKPEFIRTLTIPTKSLKRIKILDKTMKNGKIVTLKFMMK
ncbi:hypothetical protein [Pontimicrobium sp. MEBiC06410]